MLTSVFLSKEEELKQQIANLQKQLEETRQQALKRATQPEEAIQEVPAEREGFLDIHNKELTIEEARPSTKEPMLAADLHDLSQAEAQLYKLLENQ